MSILENRPTEGQVHHLSNINRTQSGGMAPTRYEIINVEGGHLIEYVGSQLLVLKAWHELRRIGLECAIQRKRTAARAVLVPIP